MLTMGMPLKEKGRARQPGGAVDQAISGGRKRS